MRLVVDASSLVAELLRKRGRTLFTRSDLELLVSAEAWEEAERHLRERADALRKRLPRESVDEMMDAAWELVVVRFEIVPANVYAGYEAQARLRIRDETDWPTLALALATEAAILTSDPDFLGSGVPTWTYESLSAELAAQSAPADETRSPRT